AFEGAFGANAGNIRGAHLDHSSCGHAAAVATRELLLFASRFQRLPKWVLRTRNIHKWPQERAVALRPPFPVGLAHDGNAVGPLKAPATIFQRVYCAACRTIVRNWFSRHI